MKMQWTIVAAALSISACSRVETGSEVMALERSSKILKLKSGEAGEAEGEFIKFSSVNYTIYETGRVDLHGDVSFKVPLLDAEIDIPFTKTYYTNAANVMSTRYKAVTEQSLQTDRLAIDVVTVSEDQSKARVKGQINRSFHWTDLFWGFDLITLELDLSGKVVQVDRVELKRSYVYYDAVKKRHLPNLNWWQDDEDEEDVGPIFALGDDEGDDEGDGGEDDGDGGEDDGDDDDQVQLTPAQIIERESNDETKIYKESKLVFE